SSTVSQTNGTGILIPCQSHHVYCLRCLRNSLDGFLESGSIPVCHSMFCDYQLSRYDLSLIPLDEHTFRRLLALVQTQQRPQCPRCHFYIDLDIIADFNQHVNMCDLENAVSCDYCRCPQSMSQLDEHVRQWRNDPMYRQEKLVDFILPRTKYPFSSQQIDFFIEMEKKNHRRIDALSIVEALAEFESVFPYELPSRECDTCIELCLYDDIYVFGCPDSHKLCYKCYEILCRTKMKNNEILTCGICSYQLPYIELKQLRVSPAERDQFVQYQVQKTFERYTGSDRGVIKCPNQNCKWAFEPENPMERFRVECQLCTNEFCSLCNQQYHYRTRCQQLLEITRQWFFWCNTERGRYLQTKAKANAAYAARLKEYERQQKAHGAQNAALRRRYQALVADEKYKEKNCRLCPHCGRVVQHMGGCSSMVCGRDYHGGNDQSGCGQSFSWDQAKPYVAAPDRKPEEVMRDLLNPENKLVVHENIK
ncbi:unnamed protein product, partial [Rotaria sp. Silwood2]